MPNHIKLILCTCICACLYSACLPYVHAQEATDPPVESATAQETTEITPEAADPPDEPEAVLARVTVTGSRIRRGNAGSAVPLQVIGVTEFRESGASDLAELLVEFPGISESISPRNSNNFIQTSGLSTIDLRRLGDDRTLVLINGKRAVSNSGNSDRVSLSTIPSGLVKRTEITTGGASAIYGSDAIAGVANFFIEDAFVGSEIRVRGLTPEASGGEEFSLEGKYGGTYANDRGYFMLAADYDSRNMIRADSSRPLSITAISFDDPSFATNDLFAEQFNQPGCMPEPVGNDRHCFLGNNSSFTPGGVFEGGDAWFVDGRWFNDQSLQPSDRTGSSDFFSDVDGFNFREGRTLIAEREIINVGGYTEYDFSDRVVGSFLLLHNQVDTTTAGGFETLSGTRTFGDGESVGNMASDHPFIPPEVEETRSGSVSFTRRLVELGEQQRINERRTTRIIADLTGQLGNNYDWEVYATYGHFEQEQSNPNEVNLRNASFALDIEADGAGGFQCADAAARAAGCVPLNVFGEGSISSEAADYIRYNGFATQTREQYSIGGYVTGEAFSFRNRGVNAVFGIEFRREAQDTVGDPDGDLVGGQDGDPNTPDFDLTSLAVFPDLRAGYNVFEAFTEIDVPLTDTLNFQAAARVGEYTTIGAITSFNVGGVWRPNNQFGVRAQFSRSQRAPNLTEFFSAPRQDADDLDDPCSGLLPDGSGIGPLSGTGGENADLNVVATNCLTEAGIQAFFADPDNAGNPFDPPGSTQGPNAGNQNLKEESADTITFGVIFQPDFIDATFIVDYYRIDVDDAITSISTQDTVDLCYSSTDFPNNRFCDVITRNPNDGNVVEVINFQENLNNELVEGIDASLDYDFDLPFTPGSWDLNLRYSHYLKDEVTFVGIGNVALTSTSLGEINGAEDEFRGALGWRYNNFRLLYTVTYEQGGIDDLVNDPDPSDDRFFEADDEFFHRIFASYRFGQDDRYLIFAGVNNIFDNFGPLLPSGLDNGDSRNIVENLNDPVGREFFAGASIRF